MSVDPHVHATESHLHIYMLPVAWRLLFARFLCWVGRTRATKFTPSTSLPTAQPTTAYARNPATTAAPATPATPTSVLPSTRAPPATTSTTPAPASLHQQPVASSNVEGSIAAAQPERPSSGSPRTQAAEGCVVAAVAGSEQPRSGKDDVSDVDESAESRGATPVQMPEEEREKQGTGRVDGEEEGKEEGGAPAGDTETTAAADGEQSLGEDDGESCAQQGEVTLYSTPRVPRVDEEATARERGEVDACEGEGDAKGGGAEVSTAGDQQRAGGEDEQRDDLAGPVARGGLVAAECGGKGKHEDGDRDGARGDQEGAQVRLELCIACVNSWDESVSVDL